MYEVLRFEDSHCGSHTHTIIRSKRSSFCSNPFFIDICLNRIIFKIVCSITIFLRNHIKVGLKNNSLPVLHSSRSRFFYDHIPNFIHNCFKAKVFSKLLHELNYSFFFFGRPGYLCKTVKMFPDIFWFKI